jgi:hypothetical protein
MRNSSERNRSGWRALCPASAQHGGRSQIASSLTIAVGLPFPGALRTEGDSQDGHGIAEQGGVSRVQNAPCRYSRDGSVIEGRGRQDPQDARSVVSREALSFDVLVLVAH